MNISYEEFQKMELRLGKVIAAGRVDGSDKLLKLTVDLGEKSSALTTSGSEGDSADQLAYRQIVAGIGKVYGPDNLIGRELLFIANLKPRLIMGIESQGMILAATDEQGPVVMLPDREVAPGSALR